MLLPQVTAPVIALARSTAGEHSVTLTVSPENLGPVTVRAHISGGGIRLELHAPSDAGRDALRATLTDLRRDLAAAAPGAHLSVAAADPSPASSSQSRPDAQTGTGTGSGSDSAAQREAQGRPTPEHRSQSGPRSGPAASPDVPRAGAPLTASSGIDVYA